MDRIIDIGTKINLDDLLESRMLIQANSGGGKSGIARVMMEESFGKVPFIVLDKKGEYYTLKEKFPDIIVIGGRNGDIQLSMQAAPLLAKFIIRNRLTVVIDMIGMEDDDQRALFIRDFLKGLMNLDEDYWVHYLIFLEEAHVFCGQQEKMPSAKYVKNLMSEGRKMGFCGILITQRISKLHKDAAAECNNKFIGRTFLDLDMNRSASEMGLVGQDKLKLRELKPQHFWAFGTSIEPHHVHEVVIKDAQTKFVKAGSKINITTQKVTDKMKQALAKLNELPQEVQKELNDMKSLRAEVKRLEGELKLAQKQSIKSNVKAPTDSSGLVQSYKSEISLLKEQIRIKDQDILSIKKIVSQKDVSNKKVFDQLFGTFTGIKKLVEQGIKIEAKDISITQLIAAASKEVSEKGQFVPQRQDFVSKTSPAVSANRSNVSIGDGTLGKCSRQVIRFLAQYPDREFSKAQVAIATGYSSGSGGFNNALSELNSNAFIIRNNGKLQVDSSQIHSIVEAVGTITEKIYDIETYKDNLGKCEKEIYEVLLKNPEHPFTKAELSQTTETRYSPDSGGFNNALSRLNTLELIHRSNGQIKLNPELLNFL